MRVDALSVGFAAGMASGVLILSGLLLLLIYSGYDSIKLKKYGLRLLQAGGILFVVSIGSCSIGISHLHC